MTVTACPRSQESCPPSSGIPVHVPSESANSETQAVDKTFGLALAAVALIALTAGIFIVVTSVVRPLAKIQQRMLTLAEGDCDSAIPFAGTPNELGAMARSIDVFRQNLQSRQTLEIEARETREKEIERQRSLEIHVKDFIAEISTAMNSLGAETKAMRRSAEALEQAAVSSHASARSAREASTRASDSSGTVASATEQLGASIREISQQTDMTRRFVAEATLTASASDAEVSRLASAVQEIGSVLSLINGIARQTNLLALNATIEAARAGEAGKGFAIVASEVKALAEQTAKATGQIGTQIDDVQDLTTKAVAAIRTISSKVGEINGLTEAIAAAVMQQDAATAEIARSVTSASEGSRQVAATTDAVTAAAEQTSGEARAVTTSSAGVRDVAGRIEDAVQSFVEAIRGDLGERRTAVRMTGPWGITVSSQGRRLNAEAFDFSRNGLRIVPALVARQGERVEISCGAMTGKAVVVWSNASGTGVRFDEPLSEVPERLMAA